MTKYMHTLEGRPAEFCEHGGFICFGNTGGPGGGSIKLADSLDQIKREQRISMEHDNAVDVGHWKYGYCRVQIPNSANSEG